VRSNSSQHYTALIDCDKQTVTTWKKWENKKFVIAEKSLTKKLLVVKSGNMPSVLDELCEELEMFTLHLFHAKWQ